MTYKERISSIFDRAAPTYGVDSSCFFHHFAEKLISFAQIKEGSHILDVATGRGAVLLRALEKTGPTGSGIGIDISKVMCTYTQKELEYKGFINGSTQEMDAETLSFPDNSFDHLFCSFALFFMPHLDKTLLEFKRVLKQGGRIAVSFPGKRDACHTFFRETAKELGAPPNLIVQDLNPEKLTAILKQLGFKTIETFQDTLDHIHPDIPSYLNSLWSHGSRGSLEELSEEDRSKLFSLLHNRLEPLKAPDGTLHEKFLVFYMIATKA